MPGHKNSEIPPDVRAQVIGLYQSGTRIVDITNQTGVSAGSIYTALRRCGIEPNRNGQPLTYNSEAVDLYLQGIPFAEIEQTTGLKPTTILGHVRRAGNKPNRQSNKR